MNQALLIEISQFLIITVVVLILVYLIRDVMDIKIATCLFFITNYMLNLSRGGALADKLGESYPLFIIITFLIYLVALVTAFVIVDRAKKTKLLKI